ncbi:MAG: hypothetical protein NTZ35_12430 [Ignavibacteriales bacterium]|nr:hypothetical protein [Ignavibacteriales bacterium]
MRRAGIVPIVVLALASTIGSTNLIAQTAGDQRSSCFIDFTAGMGIDLHSATSVVNYINLVAQPRLDEKVYAFSSAVEFYVVPEIQVSHDWSVGIEYSLLIKSYAIDDRSGFSRSDFSYQIHMPTLLLHRLILGEGYRVKMGGGIGYHFVDFSQSFPTVGSEETLSADGIGMKLDAVGNTKFDETFYGSIGVDLRWDFEGTLKRSPGAPAAASISNPLPKMSFFSAGLKFGVTFQLN